MTFKTSVVFLSILFFFASANAQEVSVSKEFNLRSDYSYEILSNVGEHIVLLRDKGLKYKLEVLGKDLSFKKTVDVEFEKSKIELIGAVNRNHHFTIYYSFKDDGMTHLAARTFNNKVEPIDSTIILKEKTKIFKQKFDLSTSEDKSKVLVTTKRGKNEYNIIAIDQDSVKLIYDDIIEFTEYDLRSDLKKTIINNEGEVFILLNKNNKKQNMSKNRIEVNYVSPSTDHIESFDIGLKDLLLSDLTLEYDDRNKMILVLGLYHDKNKIASHGYFFGGVHKHRFANLVEPIFVPYNKEVLEAFNVKKNNKELQHFKISDIIFRKDGGFLLVTEMNKVLTRRTYYNGYNTATNNRNQGLWKDYYNENIVLFAVKPSGIEHWTRVLHKKQFSQDDNDIYGSFFLFISPSRLRLLYNDEIKKDNTVSEYVLNPIGQFERNSVLSTDYQNLSLRFRDAIQISPSELLVPSQRNYNLSLVKIKY